MFVLPLILFSIPENEQNQIKLESYNRKYKIKNSVTSSESDLTEYGSCKRPQKLESCSDAKLGFFKRVSMSRKSFGP